MFYVTPEFFSYRDGVYQAAGSCIGSSGISHALLIVGFGIDNGMDYWLVQNSFGTSWGMGGFGKIRRGVNTCGIASCASYPVTIIDSSKEKRRPFQRHLYNIAETGAVCLDGTPGGLYYSKGFGDGMNKTIIHFNGGGWCYGMDKDSVANDCFYRSTTNLGSTA